MKTNSSLRGAGAVLSAITLGFGILSGVTPRTFAADCSSPPTGLVGWWRGEGDASDVTGSNGGTVVGATFVAGRVGQAFNFNGTGQKITLPDNDALKLTNSLTIEGWIFPRANGFILFRGDSRPGLDPYVLTIELTHELQLIVCNDSGGVLAFRTPGAVPMNQWLHVAATLDDATGDARLFVNGALAAQTNTTLRPFRDLDAAYGAGVAIGGHSGAYNYFSFDGMIDELSVYNRALATNEITAIYTAGTAGKCTAATPGDCVAAPAGAAGWWPGDNSPNDILGANHASINGGNNFAPGEVGNGFQFNSYSNYALIPAAPALDVGGGSGFSIEGWILPNDVAGFHPIWEWNGGEPGGATIGAHFWISHLPWSNGELFANIVGTDGSSHAFWSADGVVAPNVLQHVALTYDKASGVARILRNGQIVAESNLGSFTPKTGLDVFIGHRPGDYPGDWTYNAWFNGVIDELTLYNRGLGTNEVQAIFAAGSAGKCPLPPPNHAPIADAGATEPLVISANGSNAVVVLDGSRSSDPDGDALTYAWFHAGDAEPFVTGVVAVPALPVGTNALSLVVSDGAASSSQTLAVEVITTSQAVDRLAVLVLADVQKANALVASLRAALAAINRSQPATAINQLQAFINKVHAQLEPTDPALAAQLIADAQAIIDALNGGSGGTTATTLEIMSLARSPNGKPHLRIKGANGRTLIVETSTNLVTWVKVGTASRTGDRVYEFEDAQTAPVGVRYYRVNSPK